MVQVNRNKEFFLTQMPAFCGHTSQWHRSLECNSNHQVINNDTPLESQSQLS